MANLLINSDFENGSGSRSTAGWLGDNAAYRVRFEVSNGTLSFQGVTVQHGLQALRYNAAGADNGWHSHSNVNKAVAQDVIDYAPAIEGSKKYTLVGYLKSVGFTINAQGLNIMFEEHDAAGAAIVGGAWFSSPLAATQDWTEVTRTWTTKANAAYLYIQYIRAHGTGGDLYADNFTLEKVVGPAGVKTIQDLAIASVKTINDVAIASVKTINDAS